MKNIYRILSLTVVVILLIGVLSGCGSSASEEDEQIVSSESFEEQTDSASEEASDESGIIVAATNSVSVVSVTLIEGEDGSAEAVAVEYDSEIDADSLSSGDYMVTSQDQDMEYAITAIYTNDEPAMAENSTAGCYVIIELSENAWEAMEDIEEDVSDNVQEDITYVEDDGTEGPTAAEDEEEVVYPDGPLSESDEDDTDTVVGPEGWDPDAEVIIGVSPAEMASSEITESEDEDLGIIVIQIDIVSTVDGVEIGASPTQYGIDTIVEAE